MKKLLITATVSLALAMAANNAAATTFTLDVSAGSASIPSPNYAANFTFSDVYKFTITSAKDFSASITANYVTTTNGGVQTFALQDLVHNTTIGGTKFTNVVGTKTFTTFAIDGGSLSAGNYALLITGKGSYGGSLDLTSPVPEASTTAMMLGGLVLVGVLASRRRRKESSESVSSSALVAA